jgi:HEAT repeat protein
VNFAAIDRLLPKLGPASIEPLLDALAESESRTTRRALLDRAGRIQADIGAAVVRRLADPRWFVQRNMLVLLEALPRLPEEFSPEPYLAHSDARVRREAVKLQLKAARAAEDIGGKGTGPGREDTLRAALQDSDPRTLRIALAAVQEECADALVPLVAEVALSGGGRAPTELRVLAVRALGRAQAPQALDALLRLTSGGRSFWGRPKLPPKRPEFLAALTALATGWAANDKALAVLARAAQSDDAEVRNATEPGERTAA